jgi:hypothetical protein
LTEKSAVGVPERPGDRVLLRGCLLLLCIVVVTFCAAESLLRVTDLTQHRPSDGTYGAFRFDPELGWSAAPHSASQLISSNRTISAQHNSIGLRERELSDIAPDRILFLGDSFTWGYDAEVNERFTNLLQNELPQYGMVNAGISGYGTDQQFLLMERVWSEVEPKVVVVTFCVNNDRDDNSSSQRYFQYKPYFVRTPQGELQVRGYPLPLPGGDSNTRGAWAENLALIRVAMHIYTKLRNREIIVPDPTEQLFDMMRRTVEARGARLVVGLQRQEARLEAHLRARDIPYTTFDGAPFYSEAGQHWTPEGNAQVAKQYLALFAEIGMLRSLTTPSSRRAAPARDGSDDDQVLAQTTSLFSPTIWLAAAEALPGELVSFGRLLKAWSIAVRDTGGLPRVAAALFVVTVLATAVFIFWFWRQRRPRGASSEPWGFTKALSSFGVFLGLALAMPLSTITLLEATETRMIEITYGFVAGAIVAAFGRAVALGLLAPDAPQRRLAVVDDATARSLSRFLVWGTRALGALVLALAVHDALAAPAALTVATNMLFTLVIGTLLVHLLLSHRHGGGAGEKLPRAPWLYALGWLILGLTGIALVAGYPAFAAFVAERLVSILAVSGALYLLLALGRALLAERFALDTPRGVVITANFGVSIRSIGFAVVLTYGGMCVAVLLAALVLYIGPW